MFATRCAPGGGGPDSRSCSAFLPVHIEARGSLWFGSDPFLKVGIRPYLVLSVGLAQIDTSTSVYVPSTPKSNREKDLERLVKQETDSDRKRRLQRELDDLRHEREREDQRNKAAAGRPQDLADLAALG